MQAILRLSALLGVLLLLTSRANASHLSPFLPVPDLWKEHGVEASTTQYELARRTVDPTSCPTAYKACSNLGAPGLCCADTAVCAADQAGHVACCPSGASCTGTISSVITGGTIAAGGSAATATTAASSPLTVSASSTTAVSTSSNGFVVASGQSTTTTGADSSDSASGFILVGSSTAATLGSNARKNAQTPLIAQLLIGLMGLLPL